MHLTRLRLEEFRQYRRLDLEVPEQGFLLTGPNASGKSSLLEAIAMLATTRSPRTTAEREVVNWHSGQEFDFPPYARIEGDLESHKGQSSIEIGLQIDPDNPNRSRKIVELGGKRVRSTTAVGTLKCMLFEPADINLVAGSPSIRRRFLDVMLSQIDPVYLRSLSRYLRIVEQRNRLIKNLLQSGLHGGSQEARRQLDFWDGELVAHGSKILARRRLTTISLAEFAARRFAQFSDGRSLELEYQSTVHSNAELQLAATVTVDDLALQIAFDMASAINHNRANEFRRGMTLVGPHRDDLLTSIEGADVGTFGSRGQQRLVVVALKIAEVDLMRKESGEAPVVLLDDVYSELDERHREELSTVVDRLGAQTIVTTTDPVIVANAGLNLDPVASVKCGEFRWLGSRG